MKRATFGGPEPEGADDVERGGDHHQPTRGCLKGQPTFVLNNGNETGGGDDGGTVQRFATTSPALASLHHQHHHRVHFLTNSGTYGTPSPTPRQHVVIDLHKLRTAAAVSGDDTLHFRPLPFGMLRARHTYSTRFAVVGGRGRTQVDCVAEEIASDVSISKEPPSAETEQEDVEMFEVIFRPLSRGPFEGRFVLTVVEAATEQEEGIGSPMRTESRDEEPAVEVEERSGVAQQKDVDEDEGVDDDGSGHQRKRRMVELPHLQDQATTTSTIASSPQPSPRRMKLEVGITAQILRKGMGKPSLRDTVRCIAVDEEEDSDADSDGWAGF